MHENLVRFLAAKFADRGEPLQDLMQAVVELRVQPAALTLENARDVRRVLVSGRTKAGQWIDLSRTAKLVPASGGVRVDAEGYLHPVKAGLARVAVTAGGQRTELPV